MKLLKLFIILLLFVNCSDKKSSNQLIEVDTNVIKPKTTDLSFQLSINKYDKSQDYFIFYSLSEDQLKISIGGEMHTKNDPIVYTTKFQRNSIKQFLKINIDSLSGYYANYCISGGDSKSFTIRNNGISKTIRLDNYYHKDLSPAIELINELVPEKFKLTHNKDKLLKDILECDKNTLENNILP
ncbi:hypothetical protein H2O64_05705 [Kordia sp. YSTF-M3]|uniref:Lipoprotein n=1 Tax=Kordia aestuariivivens TaxID=2759037 RepID=A0ABR7Q6G1_9FLAO|nr:hypothetical protein [Kordia aestuariivivens]MBC8754157.1 hypothetical protein [Kordia aestuariivivens]